MARTLTEVPKGLDREWRPLLRAALDAGCTVIKKKNGVWIRARDGKGTVNMHFTTGKHNRALQNTRAELKRIGVDV